MDPINRTSPEHEPELPAALVEALRKHSAPPFEPPAALDQAILVAARSRLSRRRSTRVIRWAIPAAAAAAMLFLLLPTTRSSKPPTAVGGNDLMPLAPNRHSPVTILEAFALARRLNSGDAPPRDWDYNADGSVDRRDVRALAAAAVRLDRGT